MTNIQTLTELFDLRAHADADKTAFFYRGKAWTYGEAGAACEQLARALAGLGIQKGDRFAVVLRNSPEFIFTAFALMKLGAISVHINFLIGEEEMTYILKDSGAKGIITQKEFAAKVRKSAKNAGARWLILTDDTPQEENEHAYDVFVAKKKGDSSPTGTLPFFQVTPQTPAIMLYTSGTTGKPKGAVLTHGNLCSNVTASIAHLELGNSNEVILCILPMFHIFAWILVLFSWFLPGRLVIAETITPPKPWLAMMAKYKVTVFAAVPPIYHVLTKEAKGIKGLVLRWWFFRNVKFGISGAAPLPQEVCETFEKKFGAPILEGYGLTETSPVITINTLRKRKPGTVGTVIPGVEVKIMDDAGKILNTGEEGEICVKGPNVFKEYFNLPEATRESFTPDGYFKTGDIGRFDAEGYLTICDRKKDMIIIKGLKVFPVQIEEVILRDESVQEAAVIGVPVDGGDEIIKAYVVPKKDAEIDKSRLQKLLSSLPAYKRPREIEVRTELPKNALQKILKRELRREAVEKIKQRASA